MKHSFKQIIWLITISILPIVTIVVLFLAARRFIELPFLLDKDVRSISIIINVILMSVLWLYVSLSFGIKEETEKDIPERLIKTSSFFGKVLVYCLVFVLSADKIGLFSFYNQLVPILIAWILLLWSMITFFKTVIASIYAWKIKDDDSLRKYIRINYLNFFK